MTADPRGRRRAWLLLASWAAVILASVPLVRPLQQWLADRVGSEVFGHATVVAVVAALALAVAAGRRWRGRLDAVTLLWVALVGAAFLGWTAHLWRRPEEAVHFVEYGALSALAWNALRHHLRDAGVHLAAALLVSLLGLVDEAFQWAVPSRIWDLRDVAMNTGAGVLVQLALARLAPPPVPRLAPASLRLAARLAATEVAILALCLANTPPRLEWLCARFPSLEVLKTNPDTMAEYGHLVRDPAIGRFRSRFRPGELRRLDQDRAAAARAVLDEYPDHRYGDFLARFTPVTDPFLHELRVHLWSRDCNAADARAAIDPAVAATAWTVAARENRIVESYFGRSLEGSHLAWDAPRRAGVEAREQPDAPFESRVGSHLVTVLSEGQLRAALVAALLALLAAERWLTLRLRREGQP